MEDGNYVEGSIWKLKTGLTGNIYWRKNWVYADDSRLLQWQAKTRPKNTEEPKYNILLEDYNISSSVIKDFAFQLVHKNNKKDNFIFAVDNAEDYEAWLFVLIPETVESSEHPPESVVESKEEIEEESDEESINNVVHLRSKEIIKEYFVANNVSKVCCINCCRISL